MELSHGSLPYSPRHHPFRVLLPLTMEAGQTPRNASRAFQQKIQCCNPHRLLLSWLHLDICCIFHTTLLSTSLGRVPNSIRCLDSCFLPRNERIHHLYWDLHPEDRSISRSHHFRLSLLNAWLRAINQFPSSHQLV